MNTSIIAPDCTFGKNVTIGHYCVIHPGVTIKDNVTIGDFSTIGQSPKKAVTSTLKLSAKKRLTVIGAHTRIGSHSCIYAGVTVGKNSLIADYASIREDSRVGDKCIVGRNVMVEESVKIGNFVKIMTSSYITGFTTIQDHVFIAPCVSMANDNTLDRTKSPCIGPTIYKSAAIGVGAILLPKVKIGTDALVAAGAVVTKNVPAHAVVMGIPAKIVKK